MHFSIPETVQAVDENGSKYWVSRFFLFANNVFREESSKTKKNLFLFTQYCQLFFS